MILNDSPLLFQGTVVELFVLELALEFVLLFVLFDKEDIVLLLDVSFLESVSEELAFLVGELENSTFLVPVRW